MRKLAVGVLVTTLLTGCATIVDRASEPIAIDSDPSGAALTVTCAGRSPQEAVTPAVIRIERRAGECLAEVSKAGYAPERVTLEQGMNRRILGNLVPMAVGLVYAVTADDNLSGGAAIIGGGVLTGAGFIVDWIARRSADHDPKRVTVRLQPAATSTPRP